jgi:hypothetical protein
MPSIRTSDPRRDDLNWLDGTVVVTVLSRTLPTARTSLADYALNWALHPNASTEWLR